MTNETANHRLALVTSRRLTKNPDQLIHVSMHHSAFEYGNLDDLLANFERLEALGIKPHLTFDHGLATLFYYVDPDGDSVELQSDNFGDWAASSEFIQTSRAFAANPIGSPVDPRRMLEARRAGVSVKKVQIRAYAGEFPPSEPMAPRFPKEM